MTSQPSWSPVDDETADLLSLVATGPMASPTPVEEWEFFVEALYDSAKWGRTPGVINPNVMRQQVRDHVAPRRIGAFTSRAVARGLIEDTGGWEISDDTQGRNAGRPCRVYRWTGGEL